MGVVLKRDANDRIMDNCHITIKAFSFDSQEHLSYTALT